MNTPEQNGANPYQAPSAQLAVDNILGAGALIDHGRGVPAGNGLAWIGAGWNAFKAFPGAWIVFFIVFMLVMFAVSIIPLINILSLFITPIILGGVMLACREVDQGNPPSPGQLFAGFSTHLGKLALIGLLYLAGMMAITMIVGVLAALVLGGGITTGFGLHSIGPGMMLIVLIGAALLVPLTMSFYYAPALIMFHDIGALDAMKSSFSGTLKNFVAFIVYGIAATLLMLLGMVPFMLGLLVVSPILIYSVYAGYKDIYVS